MGYIFRRERAAHVIYAMLLKSPSIDSSTNFRSGPYVFWHNPFYLCKLRCRSLIRRVGRPA